jgi:hypothetical protein
MRANTWTADSTYNEKMLIRGIRMCELADVGQYGSVMDLGCGNQQLRPHIMQRNPDIKYVGVDYLAHCEDTLIHDFNRGEFPDIQVDLCIVSGVLEYIYPDRIRALIDNICLHSEAMAVSNHFFDTHYVAPASLPPPPAWVSRISLGELVAMFVANKFYLVNIERLPLDVFPRLEDILVLRRIG